MADIRFDTFKGIRPRVRPRLLPPNESQAAANARLGSGALEPWNDANVEQAATNIDIQSIFRMRNNGTPLWLESTNDVDYARGPVPDDTLERIYYTGEAEPRMTYIGIAAGSAPLPDDYRILGIPAPTGAPTLTGDALPDNQVTASLDSGGIQTPSLKCDFVIDQNLPFNMNSWYMALTSNGVESDNGYEPTGTERTFNFDFTVGKELRITAVIDANNVTVEDANAGSFLAAGSDDARNGQTWFRTDDTGTTRAGHFRFYLPNSIDLQMTGHNLQVDDVIRVTAVPQPVSITFTAPATATPTAGAFFGWESDNGAGFAATNTWIASPVGTTADGFFKNGSVNYPFQDVYATTSGAAGADFSIDGAVDFELIERGGEPYSDIATDIESRIYVYTFVSELGEEGPPSPASSVLTIPTDGSVTVDGFDTPPAVQRNITDMRIYRSNTGTEATEFQFVAEIADPFNAYVDTIADTELGEVLQTTTWEPPPSGLEGIVAGPNGVLAGFVGKTLWLSEPYFPHAWPPEYKQAVEHDIVGIGALPNGFAVLTKGTPYALTGDHPRGMSLQQFQFAQACSNKKSITSTLDSVMYASPDGLCEIGARGFEIVTRNHATKREWQTYLPSTMVGAWHDNKYFGFYTGGAIIFEPRDESVGFTTTADAVVAAYVDEEEDDLYVLQTGGATSFSFSGGIPSGWTARAMTFTNENGGLQNDVYSDPGTGQLPMLAKDDAIAGIDLTNVSVILTFQWVASDCHLIGPGLLDDSSTTVDPYVAVSQARISLPPATMDPGHYVDGDFPPGAQTDFTNQAGAFTLSGSEITTGVDHTLELRVVGTTMSVHFDTVQKGSWTLTAAEITAMANATKIGVFPHRADYDADDFLLLSMSVGTAGATSIPDIAKWDADSTARTVTWKSGKIKMDYPMNLGAGRILATSYPVTLNIWDQEGTNVVVDRSVTSDEVFRLPGGYLSGEFEIQVANDDTIELVHLAETVEELLQG